MPSKFQFWCNFDGFLEGKWRHVGTKIESKIDVNFERPILQTVLKNRHLFNDFSGLGGRSWHQKSIKHQSKIEAQDGTSLGIDFLWVLFVFGRQVGRTNGAKSEDKSIQQRIEKNDCVLELIFDRLGGVLEASWVRLRGQHSSKLTSQIEGISVKNRCKNR